ncbi:MAG TPA: carboxypeptidase regulatory-like domain-containing protein, partial [Verrucomicrobiae bacterium]
LTNRDGAAQRWCPQAWVAAALLALSLPLAGGAAVMAQLISQDTNGWHPGSGEFRVVMLVGGGALMAMLSSTILGLTAIERIRGARGHLRGQWPAAAAAVFWPAVLALVGGLAVLSGGANREPNCVVTGAVLDAETGKPIAGARVDDTRYGPNRAPQQAWTDASGRYELRTWYEEHTISASAPGYEPKLETLLTKPFGKEKEAQVDFRLRPATNVKPKSNYRVRMTNGMEFEAVAVTRNPRNPGRWWKPDGEPFDTPPLRITRLSEPVGDTKPEDEFLIFVRDLSPTNLGPRVIQREYHPRQMEDLLALVADGTGAIHPAAVVQFQEPRESVDLQMLTATGPWEAVAVFDGQQTRELISGVKVTCGPARLRTAGGSRMHQVDVTHDIDPGFYALRMVARLRSGEQRRAVLGGGATALTQAKSSTVVWFDQFGPEDVTDYVIERNAWVRGEIRNIALKPKVSPGLAAATFGPVIERVLAGASDASQRFIDFDTGKQFAASEFFGPKDEPSPEETQAWWKQTGIDAMGDCRADLRGLVGFEMVAVRVAQEEWERATPARLDYFLGLTKPGTPATMDGGRESFATFAIKTREGGRGLLQIIRCQESPPSVSIRFKLAATATANANGSAAFVPSDEH